MHVPLRIVPLSYLRLAVKELQRHCSVRGRAAGPKRSSDKSSFDDFCSRGARRFRSLGVHFNAVRTLRCTSHSDGDQLAIKIGVAGKVLLGPAGSPGGFSVPVRMAVLREHDNQPIVSKLYRAAVTVAAGETRADFTIVSEPLRVPFVQDHAEDDYTIKVGIDEGASADKPASKHAKP